MRFFIVIAALLLSVSVAAPVDLDATERERPVRRGGYEPWQGPNRPRPHRRDVDVNDLERERPVRRDNEPWEGGRSRHGRDVDVEDLERERPVRAVTDLLDGSGRLRPVRRDVDVIELEGRGRGNGGPPLSQGFGRKRPQ